MHIWGYFGHKGGRGDWGARKDEGEKLSGKEEQKQGSKHHFQTREGGGQSHPPTTNQASYLFEITRGIFVHTTTRP